MLLRNMTRLQFVIFRFIVPAVIIAGHHVCTIALAEFNSLISNQILAASERRRIHHDNEDNPFAYLPCHSRGSKNISMATGTRLCDNRRRRLFCTTRNQVPDSSSRLLMNRLRAADSRFIKTQFNKIGKRINNIILS